MPPDPSRVRGSGPLPSEERPPRWRQANTHRAKPHPPEHMIYEVAGDILQTRAEAIAHGVAPNDHFNQGLALALRERWPAMAKDYRHYYHVHHPKPGGLWAWGGVGGDRVINLMTQEPAPDSEDGNPGPATTKYVNKALRQLRKFIDEEGVKSVALPAVATGVGGLEWDEVRPLIEQHLGDLDIPVFLYTEYVPGIRADEPG